MPTGCLREPTQFTMRAYIPGKSYKCMQKTLDLAYRYLLPTHTKIVTQYQPSDQGLKGNNLDEDVYMDGVSYSSTTF